MELKTRAGQPICPRCGYPLYGQRVVYISLAQVLYSEATETWQTWGGIKDEQELVAIYCRTPDCGFILSGDAIHTTEVREAK